jgi:hypothetical protein
MGFGRGRGCAGGRGFSAAGRPAWARFGAWGAAWANPDPETERQALRNQADTLEAELNRIRERLAEMETKTTA